MTSKHSRLTDWIQETWGVLINKGKPMTQDKHKGVLHEVRDALDNITQHLHNMFEGGMGYAPSQEERANMIVDAEKTLSRLDAYIADVPKAENYPKQENGDTSDHFFFDCAKILHDALRGV